MKLNSKAIQEKTIHMLAGFLFGLAAVTFAQSLQQLQLKNAVQQAISQGPDVVSSNASLQNAKATLAAALADPSSLVVPLTQAKHAANLAEINFAAQKLSVMYNVLISYLNVFENQENIKVLEAQVDLDTANLKIAEAKLAAKNGTALDVAKAQNTSASDQQILFDAKAQLPILSHKLEPLLGINDDGTLMAAPPPVLVVAKIDAAKLQAELLNRIPNLVQAKQAVDLAQLNVQLSDNDYTPPNTLRDFKLQLENAMRTLQTTKLNAQTSLSDGIRNLSNALEQMALAKQNLQNTKDALVQDEAKFSAGTISKIQLQTTQMSVLKTEFANTQANNNYLRGLAQLSVAAGVDQTGLIVE